MKFLLSSLLAFAFSASALAASNCKYMLENSDYASDASGTLTVNAIKYSCSALKIGEDSLNVCRNKKTKSGYDFVVAFDGAEADFGVYTGLVDGKEALCAGKANSKAK